ncbi:MAG: hypothetical protein ACPL68_03195, partial [Candidatus Hydrothermia bacterium]
YRFRKYTVGEEIYAVNSGFVGLTAQIFSGPVAYGLSVKTTLPELAFALAEGAEGVLASGIKRKNSLLPLTIAFFFSWEAEED